MFYAHFVLAKKGPLARIWLAAHWDKKLTKAHVFETNIEKSVDGILQPKVKMALRTSGHLLLGVVRIYSRKAKYLLADCNEAFVKIKMAFRPGMVDLPEEHREAAVNAITLPEVFHDFDTTMPELNDVDIEAQFSLNQSRAEEITMREDYGNITELVNHEEGFGDMGFDTDTPELLRHATGLEQTLDQANLLFSDGVDHLEKEKEPQPSTSAGGLMSRNTLEIDAPIRDDGFGGNLSQDIIGGGLFEGGLFDDAPMGEVPAVESSSVMGVSNVDQTLEAVAAPHHDSDDDDDDDGRHFDGPPSDGGHSSDGSRPHTPIPEGLPPPIVQPPSVPPMPPSTPAPEEHQPFQEHIEDEIQLAPQTDQTTLLHNEEESFALAPVDASALKGFTKTKRKRKLIVDEVKNISGEEMKAQLSDTSDIVTTLDLAPPTKRLMHWKETGGVEKLFALPGRNIPARALFKNYQRHLTSRAAPNDDFGTLGDGEKDQLALEQVKDVQEPEVPPAQGELATQARRGRKRKQIDTEEPIVEEQQQQPVEEMIIPPVAAATPKPVSEPLGVDTAGPMSVSVPPMSVPPMSIAEPMSVPPLSVAPMSVAPPMSVGPPDVMSVAPPMSVEQQPMSVQPPQTPAPQTPYHMDVSSIPQLPPDQVSSLLEQTLVPPMTPLPDNSGVHSHPPPSVAPPTPAPYLQTPLAHPQTPLTHPQTPLTHPQTPLTHPQTTLTQPQTILAHPQTTLAHPQTPLAHPQTPLAHPQTPAPIPQTPAHPQTPASVIHMQPQTPYMENMGYNQQEAPLMANMGYDEQHPPPTTPGAISERGQATPWNEDYEFPVSVGPQAEEQQAEETYEQFEERVLNKRAAHMYHLIRTKLQKTDKLYLSDLTHRNNRKQVAQKFYSLLVLKKFQVLEIHQESSYDEILIDKGVNFDNPTL